jgi:hypothetical protein
MAVDIGALRNLAKNELPTGNTRLETAIMEAPSLKKSTASALAGVRNDP